MANLQVKGINDELYSQLKARAESENRSVSQEVIRLLKSYLAKRQEMDKTKTPARVLLELSGSWEDARSGDKILADLRKARKKSKKLSGGF